MWEICVCAQSFSCVFVIPWTVACQVSLLVGFSKQEYWHGLPLPFSWPTDQTQVSCIACRFFTTGPPAKQKGKSMNLPLNFAVNLELKVALENCLQMFFKITSLRSQKIYIQKKKSRVLSFLAQQHLTSLITPSFQHFSLDLQVSAFVLFHLSYTHSIR